MGSKNLDELDLEDLEVKKRLLEEDIKEKKEYSLMHRISKRIHYDIYKILLYFLVIQMIIYVGVFLLMTIPVFINPSQEETQFGINLMPIATIFIIPMMITILLFTTDQTRDLRNKLNYIERIIRIKQDVYDNKQQQEFGDESETLEYKSSFKYDYKTGNPNRTLKKEVVQTVVGFLNFNGGTLKIGVSDKKEQLGIENDLKLCGGDWDKYRLEIQNALKDYTASPITKFVTIYRKIEEDKTFCYINVNPSPKDIFFKDGPTEDFYIRDGNQTRKLTTKEYSDYIKIHRLKK